MHVCAKHRSDTHLWYHQRSDRGAKQRGVKQTRGQTHTVDLLFCILVENVSFSGKALVAESCEEIRIVRIVNHEGVSQTRILRSPAVKKGLPTPT